VEGSTLEPAAGRRVAQRGDLHGVETLGKVSGPGVGGRGDIGGGGGVLGGVASGEETGEEASQAQGGDFQEATCGAAGSRGRHEQRSKCYRIEGSVIRGIKGDNDTFEVSEGLRKTSNLVTCVFDLSVRGMGRRGVWAIFFVGITVLW